MEGWDQERGGLCIGQARTQAVTLHRRSSHCRSRVDRRLGSSPVCHMQALCSRSLACSSADALSRRRVKG